MTSFTTPIPAMDLLLLSPSGLTQPEVSWGTEQVKKDEDIIWRDEWGMFRTPIISSTVCTTFRTKGLKRSQDDPL